MANLPEWPAVDSSGARRNSSGGGAPPPLQNWNSASVDQLIELVPVPQYRELAMLLLHKKLIQSRDLALPVWNSSNTIYILLTEVIATYKLLTPSKLTYVAAHPETRMPFVNAKIPVYLYPFLDCKEYEKPFETLRVSSLGVIGVLVEDPLFIHLLLETESFPFFLRCMDVGCQWAKILATFIVIKILEQEEGLKYCCDFEDRFYAVVGVLGGMVKKLAENPSIRPLTLIIKCFVVLTEMPRAGCALKSCLPSMLRDATFSNIINVATFVVTKILIQEEGCAKVYCCDFEDQFYAVIGVLRGIVEKLPENPPLRLLKHIIRCFLFLKEMPRACCALESCLPSRLRDPTFSNIINDDPETFSLLQNMFYNLGMLMDGS